MTLLLASTFIINVNSALRSTPPYSASSSSGSPRASLLKFKTFKTEGVGINSLQTFQSFLKSWVSQKPADLENYFTLYSHDEPVTTRIVLASAATGSRSCYRGSIQARSFPSAATTSPS